jgi:V/A-type H+-transporting ATPase subunit I
VEYIIHKKHDPTLPFSPSVFIDFIMEWFVEMIEIVGGYLSNTLSFMRVAGLGIAHVSLMYAFMEMAKLAGPVGGVVIFVSGNILVIGLEGLSAGIQSLRLNYYEFFSKYFSGTGKAYSPVSLRSTF